MMPKTALCLSPLLWMLAAGCAPHPVRPVPVPESLLLDPDEAELDDRIERAAECFREAVTQTRLAVQPATVRPFESTAVEWAVQAPAGCRMTLSVAATRTDDLAGRMAFTPLREASTVQLFGHAHGQTGVLASRQVSVDVSGCIRNIQISESEIKEQLGDEIEEQAGADPSFDVLGNPRRTIEIRPNGIAVALPMRVFKVVGGARLAPLGTAVVDMLIGFTVRDGVVLPSFGRFRVLERSELYPDLDFDGGTITRDVDIAISEKSDELLRQLRTGFNDVARQRLGSLGDRRLFEIRTESQQLVLTVCPDGSEPPAEEPRPPPPSCLDACRRDRNECQREGDLRPSICVALFDRCGELCER